MEIVTWGIGLGFGLQLMFSLLGWSIGQLFHFIKS